MAALAFLVAGVLTPAFGDAVPPWEEPNPASLTLWWNYDFNDGFLPPTVSAEGGHSSVPTDPVWTITGSGDQVSVAGGMLGLHNATQASQADIFILVPNGYDASQIKYVWFAYDWVGGLPLPSIGTTNAGHTVSGITYTANTAGNHVEGFATIDPQPQNEWLNIHLAANVGGTTAIDNLQVGSSCIPEPSSVILLALGGLIMVKARKGLLTQLGRADANEKRAIKWNRFFTSTANY